MVLFIWSSACLSVLSFGGQSSESNIERARNLESHIAGSDENNDQCELCSGKNDICSHEVLQDGGPDSESSPASSKMIRKVSHCVLSFMRSYISVWLYTFRNKFSLLALWNT